jgi:hemolysin III
MDFVSPRAVEMPPTADRSAEALATAARGTWIRRCVKDPFPGLSHWFGAALSVAALVALLMLADGRPRYVVAFAIYGASMVLLYLASAVAHSAHCSPRTEDRLNRLDYAAIFLLIAGTYTPICLIPLRGPLGWWLLAAVWSLAAVGIVSVFLYRGLKNWPRVLLYVAMGWLCVLAAGELIRVLSPASFWWLIAGGLVYSVGALVFLFDRPHLWPGRFAAHDLWHCMVLVGSACHFVVMLQFA